MSDSSAGRKGRPTATQPSDPNYPAPPNPMGGFRLRSTCPRLCSRSWTDDDPRVQDRARDATAHSTPPRCCCGLAAAWRPPIPP